jgi:hypothetical protein
MDPSFGGGVFLDAAVEQIDTLGGNPRRQVFGVEIDESAYRSVADRMMGTFSDDFDQLLRSDFFGIDPAFLPKMTAIVGNPPFIRFHRFAGPSRERAQRRARESGVLLSELASSWAAFLVHSTAFLRPGGRLAMVVPQEICHAAYAQPVLRHLAACFREVTILTFREKVFPELNENTSLLLADNYSLGNAASFYWNDLQNVHALDQFLADGAVEFNRTSLDSGGLLSGAERFAINLLAPEARNLYSRVVSSATKRLGEISDIGIGYVTGANDFFHLSDEDAARRGIPKVFLKKAVRRGRSILHLAFTERDWQSGLQTAESSYLLHISPGARIPPSVEKYLQEGEQRRVPDAYKCRVRQPWFAVPHVRTPDLFLSYMTGERARLTANRACAVAPNSLHIVRLLMTCEYSAEGVAALWQTSLTRLSCELEGHALGGGMLKLEPREAERVSLVWPRVTAAKLDAIARELDGISRSASPENVQRRADRYILQDEVGLSEAECDVLYQAAETLANRRMFK